MPTAWFIVEYVRVRGGLDYPAPEMPTRNVGVDEWSEQIWADGGDWDEIEVGGNRALVKMGASAATLDAIEAEGHYRFPVRKNSDSLSVLSKQQIGQMTRELRRMGFTNQEIDTALPDLSTFVFVDYLDFARQRRFKPFYDETTDEVRFDLSNPQPTKLLEQVDAKIPDED